MFQLYFYIFQSLSATYICKFDFKKSLPPILRKKQTVIFLSYFLAPSSPVQNRRLLSARNARMSSVEMPDDNEKSVSSASTSPCHSPVSNQNNGTINVN